MDAIKTNHISLNLPSNVLLDSNSIYFACPQCALMYLNIAFFIINLAKSLDNFFYFIAKILIFYN